MNPRIKFSHIWDKLAEPEWPILYIDLPTGQVSWHIPKKEMIGDWPIYQGQWDGHDLGTKRNRLKAYMEVK